MGIRGAVESPRSFSGGGILFCGLVCNPRAPLLYSLLIVTPLNATKPLHFVAFDEFQD